MSESEEDSVDQEITEDLINEYIEFVEEQADNKSDTIFTNSSMSHSVVIAKNMFASADNEIKIFSGTLTEIYFKKIKGYLEEAAKKINKKHGIKIITVDENSDKAISKLLKFFDDINKKVSKEVISYIALKNNGESKDFSHFYVVDKRAWRVEEPHETNVCKDTSIKAKACFNDIKLGQMLTATFDELWDYINSK